MNPMKQLIEYFKERWFYVEKVVILIIGFLLGMAFSAIFALVIGV